MLLRSWLLWLCMLLLLGAVIEASSAVFLRFVFPSTAQFLLWKPDLDEVRAAWSADMGRWDDELGWPSPQEMISPPRDPTGAKLNSDFPKTGDACASAYGDLFVWGDDIPLADGWVEALSRNLGCRVANYGVSGYGTDQAYLRFRRNTRDEAPIVLLGIFPENVMRNVNQYRAFLGFSLHPYWLKGRFALDGSGHLDWIPRPRIDAADFIRLHTAACARGAARISAARQQGRAGHDALSLCACARSRRACAPLADAADRATVLEPFLRRRP